MARRKRKPGHNPEMYKCGNPKCERTTPLAVRQYQTDLPQDADPGAVHFATEPDMGGFTLLCSACGHYTVVGRFERRPQGE
jgi:hypothetical protein